MRSVTEVWFSKKKKGSLLVFVLCAVLALGFLASITSGYTPTSPTDVAQPQVVLQTSVAQLYQNVQDSVVVITAMRQQSGTQVASSVEGSGFIYSLDGHMMIITNYHVVYQGVNISVTFRNGNGYAATVAGADPYADLAVIFINAPASEYKPLQIASSSNLKVGDFVAAFGAPFGYSGSITTGIVSQIGRTITETTTASFPIANVIQTDASINPGNSGGPLFNSDGQVVGINTAGVTGSQGVGFAIPSDTILRELSTLVATGTYTQHSYLGITSVNNRYDIATAAGLSLTYGVIIQSVTSGGPAANAGLKAGTNQISIGETTVTVGGDVIVALNQTRIINSDELSSYLEANTLPGQTVVATVLRDGQTVDVPIVLGTRPAPTGFTAPSVPEPLPSPTSEQSLVPSPSASPVVAEFASLIAVAILGLGSLAVAFLFKFKWHFI